MTAIAKSLTSPHKLRPMDYFDAHIVDNYNSLKSWIASFGEDFDSHFTIPSSTENQLDGLRNLAHKNGKNAEYSIIVRLSPNRYTVWDGDDFYSKNLTFERSNGIGTFINKKKLLDAAYDQATKHSINNVTPITYKAMEIYGNKIMDAIRKEFKK